MKLLPSLIRKYLPVHHTTKAALLILLQTWHVILHKSSVSLINLYKHTNKCPMFPEYTFPFAFLKNIGWSYLSQLFVDWN